MPTAINVLQIGATKENPFTIVIAANPALETPWNSGLFTPDPILGDQPGFDATAQYVLSALFGGLPGQREVFLTDAVIQSNIRVVTLFVDDPPPAATDPNALVAQDDPHISNQLIARRSVFNAFLARYGLHADVAFAVSASPTHTRATSWYTTDDDTRGGVPFSSDGMLLNHRYHAIIPGTVAIHITSASLTALHEFGHALSSYTNGSVTDLYVDSTPALNNKNRLPATAIPANFADYNGVMLTTDPTRNGLGYPPGWASYHCELNNAVVPSVMDDYWQAPTAHPGSTVEECEHDRITRQFLRDRLLAKLAR